MNLEIIKKYEGFSSQAYKCPAGVWTVGWGHTGRDINKDTLLTREEAELMLKKDVANLQEQILFLLDGKPSMNELDALTSLVYNIGLGAFKKSRLLKRINLKENGELIAKEWIEFNKVNGKVVKGLLRRRAEEICLYFTN